MEFQVPVLSTSEAILGNIGATAAVAPPDDAFDFGRDVTRVSNGAPTQAGSERRHRQLPPLNVPQQQRQSSIEDGAEIAVWDLAAKEISHLLKSVDRLLANRKLDPQSLGRQRLDDRDETPGPARQRARGVSTPHR
jgi:hypothetical protein